MSDEQEMDDLWDMNDRVLAVVQRLLFGKKGPYRRMEDLIALLGTRCEPPPFPKGEPSPELRERQAGRERAEKGRAAKFIDLIDRAIDKPDAEGGR